MIALLAAAACGEATPPGGGPVETREVSVVDNAFQPPDIIVPAGETVTWTWTGFEQHRVVFDDTSIPPSSVQAGGTYEAVFDLVGTYSYFCDLHGRSVMSGSVEVRALDPEPE